MDEDLEIIEDYEETGVGKDKEDLRSVLNKKEFSNFELDEVMMEGEIY